MIVHLQKRLVTDRSFRPEMRVQDGRRATGSCCQVAHEIAAQE